MSSLPERLTLRPSVAVLPKAGAAGTLSREIRRIFTGALPTELKVHVLYPENRTITHTSSGNQSLLPSSRRSSPRAISTGQLHTLLHFHLRPINQVVFLGPYSMKDERSNLRGSFTLRCFQRLSRPYLATQLCRWHDNWCTRGMSIPVLSY